MEKLLEGKYALITGGGRGIGRAVAIDFAKNGANVAVTSRTTSELDETVAEIEKYNVKGLAISADLSNMEDIDKIYKTYSETFPKCDILVNNAGLSSFSDLVDEDIQWVQKVFNVNILASYYLTKLILPDMIKQKSGKIIITSSLQGNTFFSAKKTAYAT